MAEKNSEKEYSVTELAEKYNVKRRIVLGWISGGKFPNARKVTPPVGKSYWLVPDSDLTSFTPPGKPGRPLSDTPSAAALAKRQQRKQTNKNN
jgi:hypothetical protein